jgi:lanosterol synthase
MTTTTQTNIISSANGTTTRKGKANGAVNGHGGVNGTANGSTSFNKEIQKTDYSRWRLENIRGCQIWKYMESDEANKAWPQSVADKYHLGMDTVSAHVLPDLYGRLHTHTAMVETT